MLGVKTEAGYDPQPASVQAYIRLHNAGVRFSRDGETLLAGPAELVREPRIARQIRKYKPELLGLILEWELAIQNRCMPKEPQE